MSDDDDTLWVLSPSDLEKLERRIAKARADGYRAGIEKAARVAEEWGRYPDKVSRDALAKIIAKDIRALARAATTEKP